MIDLTPISAELIPFPFCCPKNRARQDARPERGLGYSGKGMRAFRYQGIGFKVLGVQGLGVSDSGVSGSGLFGV